MTIEGSTAKIHLCHANRANHSNHANHAKRVAGRVTGIRNQMTVVSKNKELGRWFFAEISMYRFFAGKWRDPWW